MIEEGMTAYLPDFGHCVIVARVDAALWTVRLPTGTCIKLGDTALRHMLATADDAKATP